MDKEKALRNFRTHYMTAKETVKPEDDTENLMELLLNVLAPLLKHTSDSPLFVLACPPIRKLWIQHKKSTLLCANWTQKWFSVKDFLHSVMNHPARYNLYVVKFAQDEDFLLQIAQK